MMQRLAGRRSRASPSSISASFVSSGALSKASPHLSGELLLRAVAYRMQELALGGLRPEWQFAEQLKQGGATLIRSCRELKPGTWLVREWQG